MFNGSYFGAHYWAPRFFPKVGLTSIVTPAAMLTALARTRTLIARARTRHLTAVER